MPVKKKNQLLPLGGKLPVGLDHLLTRQKRNPVSVYNDLSNSVLFVHF